MTRSALWNRVEGPVPTADGSWTLRNRDNGQLFHNSAGAWSEAYHHYAAPLQAALPAQPPAGSWRFFDACFGLGYATWALLEAWATRAPAEPHHSPLAPIEVLAYEVDGGLAAHWPRVLEQPLLQRLRPFLEHVPPAPRGDHPRVWETRIGTRPVRLELRRGDFREALRSETEPFDAVLHDPFAPMRAAHLWTLEIFERYFAWLAPRGGCLATYSTSVAVLGAMRSAGFHLMRTPPLGKKRGGTLAWTQAPTDRSAWNAWQLPAADQQTLGTRSALPYRDPSFEAQSASLIRVRNQEVRDSALPPRTAKQP